MMLLAKCRPMPRPPCAFSLEASTCRCGGKLKVIPSIEEPEVIERILTHRRERGDDETSTLPLGSQAPPQAQLL